MIPGSRQTQAYQSSGRVRWGALFPMAVATLAAAAVMAIVLYWVFRAGFYFIIVVPALAAAPLFFLVPRAVTVGHCRSRLVGGLLGLVAGAILYLGYYHAGLVDAIGIENVHRVDILPDYIRFRMATDIGKDFPPRSPSGDEESSDEFGNWLAFVLELGLIAGLLAWLGVKRSGRAYCETCRNWMSQALVTLPPGQGVEIVEWLDAGGTGPLAWQGPPDAKPDTKKARKSTAVLVDRCPAPSPGADPCPAYVSVKEASISGGLGSAYDRFELARGKTLLRRRPLGPAELAALGRRFPALQA